MASGRRTNVVKGTNSREKATHSSPRGIGGYHSATGAQSYTYSTYIDHSGEFAQDVSALSHEIGECVDDPLVANPNGNQTHCGILDVGDPLETIPITELIVWQ